jgi:hypothetical protein
MISLLDQTDTQVAEPKQSVCATSVTTEPYFPTVFDSSMISAWKSCPALFNLAYLHHWKSKGDSVHLVAGKAFARGLEVARTEYFANNRPADDSIALGLQALLIAYGDFECPADSAKSPTRMAGAFEYYFENYPFDREHLFPIVLPGGKHAIEFSFAHPLPIAHPITGDPLLFCGRMDSILDYSGSAMICDEKTTSQLGPTWSRQWDLRGQFTGYAWGCREAGIKVHGSVIRGVSILKSKYETQQAIIFSHDWQIERWFDETCDWIEGIVSAWKRKRFNHNLGDACSSYGGCGFKMVCSSQEEAKWLDTYFERRQWNPLSRQETKL